MNHRYTLASKAGRKKFRPGLSNAVPLALLPSEGTTPQRGSMRMHDQPSGRSDPLFPSPGLAPLSPAQVADLIETLAQATSLLRAESRALAESRAALSTATIDRLVWLAAALRPGAAARAALATIPPQLLLDGAASRLGRLQAPARLAPAAVRAKLRWAGRPAS